jgi:hypothetical protein
MALYLSGFTNVAVFNCRRSANVATIAAQFEAQKARCLWRISQLPTPWASLQEINKLRELCETLRPWRQAGGSSFVAEPQLKIHALGASLLASSVSSGGSSWFDDPSVQRHSIVHRRQPGFSE